MSQPIENILAKYFAGEASQKEQEQIDRWREEHSQLFESYRKAFHAEFFETKVFSKKKTGFFTRERKLQNTVLFKVAAAFVGLMVVGTLLYFYSQSLNVRYANTTASVQHVVLPDGSEAYLDKHAVLQYRKNLLGNFNREVAMSGRVFFHVLAPEKENWFFRKPIASGPVPSGFNISVIGKPVFVESP